VRGNEPVFDLPGVFVAVHDDAGHGTPPSKGK
jgi:hypothetical protein